MINNPAILYTDGIHEELKTYWGGWFPNSKFSLGDVGILRGNFFERFASLESPQININFNKSQHNDFGSLEYMSKAGVEVTFKVAGEINNSLPNVPQAKAGINLKFSSEGAFLVQIPEASEVSIDNMLSLQETIIDKFEAGDWVKNWVIITKIINAPTGTFFISNSSESSVEYELEGNLNYSLADLGSANTQFSLRTQKGNILKLINAKDISPFFQLSKLKAPFFDSPFLEGARNFQGKIDPIDFITPESARTNKDIRQRLILDVVD